MLVQPRSLSFSLLGYLQEVKEVSYIGVDLAENKGRRKKKKERKNNTRHGLGGEACDAMSGPGLGQQLWGEGAKLAVLGGAGRSAWPTAQRYSQRFWCLVHPALPSPPWTLGSPSLIAGVTSSWAREMELEGGWQMHFICSLIFWTEI